MRDIEVAAYGQFVGLSRPGGQAGLEEGAGPTLFATFESETDYFGSSAQETMLNCRVRDVDAKARPVALQGSRRGRETQDMEGVGRFGWVTDPEGNRVELWQRA